MNESVYSLHEYAEDKIMIALQMTDLLIIDKWHTLNVIQDPRAGNVEKFWIGQLPGFEIKDYKFPWLVCTGKESINLINVITGIFTQLIHGLGMNFSLT